jgi:hydrogenase-4 component E
MTGVNIVNSLAVFLIITSLLVVEAGSPRLAAQFYSLQSLVLVLIFLSLAVFMPAPPLYIWALTALATKVFLVPYIIIRGMKKIEGPGAPGALAPGGSAPENLAQPGAPLLGPAASLFVATLFIALAFVVVTPFQMPAVIQLKPALAVSIALFLLGVLCILTHRNVMQQILGYCLMENGAHLALAFMAFSAPETVGIGILTDAIFAVIVMGMIARVRLFSATGTLDTDRLTSLKG